MNAEHDEKERKVSDEKEIVRIHSSAVRVLLVSSFHPSMENPKENKSGWIIIMENFEFFVLRLINNFKLKFADFT